MQVEQIEGLDDHLALGDLDILTRTHALMRPPTIDAYGTHRTRPLAHLPAPRAHGRLDLIGGHPGALGTKHLPLCVIRRGGNAKSDGRDVFLALRGEVTEKPCRGAQSEDQDSRGKRIERACMTHPARAPGLAGARDHGVRRRALGLIEDDDAVRARGRHPVASSSSEGWR